jgi:hypothetical protein
MNRPDRLRWYLPAIPTRFHFLEKIIRPLFSNLPNFPSSPRTAPVPQSNRKAELRGLSKQLFDNRIRRSNYVQFSRRGSFSLRRSGWEKKAFFPPRPISRLTRPPKNSCEAEPETTLEKVISTNEPNLVEATPESTP